MSRGKGKRSARTELVNPRGGTVPYHEGEAQAALLDELELTTMSDYVQTLRGGTPMGRYSLRESARAPWIQAIHGTRMNQVAEFSVQRDNEFELGYDIVLVEREASMTAADHRESDRIRDLLSTCGDMGDGYDAYTRDGFDTFLRKTVDDSLTLDGYAWEIVPDAKGRPAAWHNVDAATIYKVAPKDARGIYLKDHAAYCQVIDGQPKVWWPADELCYGVRRPSTDLKSMGYGRSELVDLAYVVTTLLQAWQHNSNYYENGGMKGVLAVIGAVAPEQLRLFKRRLLYQSQGVHNAHKLTVVNPQGDGADLRWVPFTGLSPKDLEFGNLINAAFLLSCAVYSIDPSEVGFYMSSGASGQARQSLNESSPESKLKAGRDKGLRPLLRHIQSNLNRYIVSRLNPRFRIKFLGMDAMSEKDRIELDKGRLETYMTVPELREERNMPPLKLAAMLDDPAKIIENMILNPTYFQALQFATANMAQEGAPEPGAEVGAPDEGGTREPTDEELAAEAQSREEESGFTPDEAREPAPAEEPAPMAKSMVFEVFV